MFGFVYGLVWIYLYVMGIAEGTSDVKGALWVMATLMELVAEAGVVGAVWSLVDM